MLAWIELASVSSSLCCEYTFLSVNVDSCSPAWVIGELWLSSPQVSHRISRPFFPKCHLFVIVDSEEPQHFSKNIENTLIKLAFFFHCLPLIHSAIFSLFSSFNSLPSMISGIAWMMYIVWRSRNWITPVGIWADNHLKHLFYFSLSSFLEALNQQTLDYTTEGLSVFKVRLLMSNRAQYTSERNVRISMEKEWVSIYIFKH